MPHKNAATERGVDTNFPLSETLRLLVEWAQHLHVSHECDCHGWEQRSFLIEAAQRYQREIAATASPAAPKEEAVTLVQRWISTLQDESHVTDEDAEDLVFRIIAHATTPSPDAAREAANAGCD